MAEEISRYGLVEGIIQRGRYQNVWIEIKYLTDGTSVSRLAGSGIFGPTCYANTYQFFSVLDNAHKKAKSSGTAHCVIFFRGKVLITSEQEAKGAGYHIVCEPSGKTILDSVGAQNLWVPKDIEPITTQKFLLLEGALAPYFGEKVYLEMDFTKSKIRLMSDLYRISTPEWFSIEKFFRVMNQARIDSANDGVARYIYESIFKDDDGEYKIRAQKNVCPYGIATIAISPWGHTILGWAEQDAVRSTLVQRSAHLPNFYFRR